MRKLEANARGRSGAGFWNFETGIRPEHNVVDALAQVFSCFDRELELHKELYLPYDAGDPRLRVLFEVQYPQHYAFITVGVQHMFRETWTYGHRGSPRNEQVRRVREAALREIAQALRSKQASEAAQGTEI